MDELQEVHARLAHTPGVLRSLMTIAPPDALAFREAPGTWIPLELLCHVTDAEIHDWMPRVEIILSGSRQAFTPFDREAGFADGRSTRSCGSSNGSGAATSNGWPGSA